MKFFKYLMGYFFAGMVFWLPIGIVVVVCIYIFGNLEEIGRDVLEYGLSKPKGSIHPGFGILFWLIIFFLTGVVLKRTPVGNLLAKIPIIGIFFRRKGDAITLDMLMKLSPCLFLYSPTCLSYGWILSEQRVQVNGEDAPFELVNIYYPNTPTIVTGQVYSVRKDTIIKIGNPSREVIDILLYGFRRPKNIQYVPWEGETDDAFKKRAKRFGLIQECEMSPASNSDSK